MQPLKQKSEGSIYEIMQLKTNPQQEINLIWCNYFRLLYGGNN